MSSRLLRKYPNPQVQKYRKRYKIVSTNIHNFAFKAFHVLPTSHSKLFVDVRLFSFLQYSVKVMLMKKMIFQRWKGYSNKVWADKAFNGWENLMSVGVFGNMFRWVWGWWSTTSLRWMRELRLYPMISFSLNIICLNIFYHEKQSIFTWPSQEYLPVCVIIQVNLIFQSLTTNCEVIMQWDDAFLVWDPRQWVKL